MGAELDDLSTADFLRDTSEAEFDDLSTAERSHFLVAKLLLDSIWREVALSAVGLYRLCYSSGAEIDDLLKHEDFTCSAVDHLFNAIETDLDFSAEDHQYDSLGKLDWFAAVYCLCDCLEAKLDDFVWVEPDVTDFLAADRFLNFTWTELDLSETDSLLDIIQEETDNLLTAECDEGIMVADGFLNSVGTELIALSVATHWLLDIKDILFDLTVSCCLVEFLCGQFIHASDSTARFFLCLIDPLCLS